MKALSAARSFVRKHWLLVGLLLACTALLQILFLQFRSLSTLETTLPSYRRNLVSSQLEGLTEAIERHYHNLAESALGIPADRFPPRDRGSLPVDRPEDLPELLQPVADHFSQADTPAASRLFVVVSVTIRADSIRQYLLMYDRESRRMFIETDGTYRSAIFPACAPYVMYMRSNSRIDGATVSVDSNRAHRLLLRPVLDGSQRAAAVAGMVLSEDYFTGSFLPAATAEWDSGAEVETAITVRRRGGDVVFSNRKLDAYSEHILLPLQFVFTDWLVGAQYLSMSEEQFAREYLIFNLLAALLSATVLIGGLVVAFRAASREVRLSRLKSDFVSNVSHELRTPLSSIRVFAELFSSGRVTDPEKVREFGRHIEKESRRLGEMIDRVLDLSRIESGRQSYTFERVRWEAFVRNAVSDFRLQAVAQEFDFRIDAVAGSASVDAQVDVITMTQAVHNLLENAVKYSGASRTVAITIRGGVTEAAVDVADNGIGIPAEDLEKIFDRFHRVSTGMTHDVNGTGLGLAIVKHIVQAHRGSVRVQSEPGRGSVFTIEIPRTGGGTA